MRILHTSDWHLGRWFGSFALLRYQEQMIDRLVEIVVAERVDLVVVSGDVHDRAVPPAEAVALFREALVRLRATGAQVAVISGNHDSADRLAAFDGLLAPGLHLTGGYRGAGSVVTIEFEDGPVDVVLVPYLDPLLAPSPADDGDGDGDGDGDPDRPRSRRRTHAQVLGRALELARATRRATRSVVLAHAFVAGASASDSERDLSVGGADAVSVELFGGFSYVALGHLHRPQNIGETVRYSGSPLAYSFSETEPKSATIVELDAAGRVSVTPIELGVCRGVRTISGTFEDLISNPAHRDAEHRWVRAQLTDAEVVIESMARLRERFPYAVELQRLGDRNTASWDDAGAIIEDRRTTFETVSAFWAATHGDLDPDVAAVLEAAVARSEGVR